MTLLAALVLAGPAAALTPPVVPANLAVAPGNTAYLLGHARGYQIYVCQAQSGGGFAWVLQAPRAVLLNDAGQTVAVHYAGPSWRSPDSSVVVATRIASAPSPVPTAIPWLLLRATSNSGPARGAFTATTFIQRVNTTGGLAPVGGCDAAHVGTLNPVYYTADYYFYRAG